MAEDALCRKVFDDWRQALEARPELAADYRGAYKFVISGNGCWLLDCREEPVLGGCNEDDKADVTAVMSVDDLAAIAEGRRSVAETYLEGRLALAGNADSALRLGLLLNDLRRAHAIKSH